MIFHGARVMAEGHEDRERSDAYRRQELDANLMHTSSVKRKKWDGTRITRITRIGTDDKISVDIHQIRVIRVLFQLRIENQNYLSHFEKRYTLDQSNYLTDDQCNLMDAAKPVASGASVKKCAHCGATVPMQASFCGECGSKLG